MSSASTSVAGLGFELVEHDGFFYEPTALDALVKMSSQFKAREDDVFVCSGMKTGTTWLKAMVASIMSESKGNVLKDKNPHELIPQLGFNYSSRLMGDPSNTSIAEMPSPRLFGTHLPFSSLPPQIISLGCRIIYIARNPKDTFVSHWKFLPAVQAVYNVEPAGSPVSKEVFFDSFINGVSLYGPYVDHVLGFWNASRNRSNVLFLTYEDMITDSLSHVRKISDFLGQSSLTEKDIRCIDSQCSFQSLSTLDVNKTGKTNHKNTNWDHRSLFRKGEVGDWKNYFTPEMNRRMDMALENKFQQAGLFLKYEV